MLKDEQSEKLGVFSSVEISDYKFFQVQVNFLIM